MKGSKSGSSKSSQSLSIVDVSKANELTKRLYTIPELIRVTGITRRQATYWTNKGLLIPTMRNPKASGSQPAFFYSAIQVIKCLIICDLLKRGFSLQQVQQVARNLEDRGIQLEEPEMYLLTDGYSVYYAKDGDQVIDTLKHLGQRMLLVPIYEQVEKLLNAA